MARSSDPTLGINSWLEDELYYQYQFDRSSVDEGWKELFQESGPNGTSQNGVQATAAAVAEPVQAGSTPYGPETPQQEPQIGRASCRERV